MIHGSDILADVFHVIVHSCRQCPTFKAHMAHVRPVEAEAAAVLAEIFAVFLGEAVETGMTLKLLCTVAAAVGIDFPKDLLSERVAGTE